MLPKSLSFYIIEITQRMVKAGEILGIPVLDHIIITDNEFLSLKEAGHL